MELCNGRLDDRQVEKRRRRQEPVHWQRATTWRSSQVVARGGVVARVQQEHTVDALEPGVSDESLALLAELTPAERRALLSTSPTATEARPPQLLEPASGEEKHVGAFVFSTARRSGADAAVPGKRRREVRRRDGGTTRPLQRSSTSVDAARLSFGVEE